MYAVYNSAKNVLTSEISNTNRLTLENIRQVCDSRLSYIDQMTVYMANNETSGYWAENFLEDNTMWKYSSRELINAFSWYNEISGDFEEAFLYFSSADIAVNNRSYMDNKDLYDKLNLEMTYQQWIEYLLEDTKSGFVKIKTKDGESKFLYVARNYYTRMFGKANMSFGVIFNFEQTGVNFSNLKNMPIGIYMNDDYGNSFNLHASPNVKLPEDAVDSKDYLRSTCRSKVWNIDYICLMPYEYVFKNLNRLRIIFYVILSVWTFLGIICGIFLSKRNYRFIDELFVKIQKIKNNLEDEEKVSFSNIDEFVNDVVRHNNMLQSDNVDRKKILEKRTVLSLVNGDFVAGEEKKLLLCGLDFSSDYFEVLLVRFICDDPEETKIYSYAAANIIEEIFQKDNKGYTVTQDSYVVCLVNCAGEETVRNIITKCFDTVKRVMKEEFGAEMVFAAGDVVKGIDNIRNSYLKALFMTDYQIIFEKNNILFYDDVILPQGGGGITFDAETENCLIGAIETSNLQAAEEMIDRVFKRWTENYPQYSAKPYIGYHIYCAMLKAVERYNKQASLINEVFDYGEELIKTDSVYDTKTILKQLAKFLCTNMGKKTILIEDKVMDYIDREYANPNLSLIVIAEYMGMNPAYLSNSFKAQCGYGISEGITKVRMAKALPLLKEHGYTVEKVSKSVGYLNFRTFTGNFKKIYGMTPTEYAKMMQNNISTEE